ncbi:uncharacterized protein LOC122087977 [Macadamia integrifolia]|uniref:uncharacterized protein LOC122087977 n=1 Tax=Macadamia integrifolia TaxID=60698 RepID=UPI001C4EA08D|nr:uncharacterized protein LOC122087977 [Macadamia integrifolia]XP_042513054.1 uncharacterized protein LOC122087977 [Macadamia integrifolia]
MVSASDARGTEEGKEDLVSGTASNEIKCHVVVGVSSSRRGLLGHEDSQNGALGLVAAHPSRAGFLKFASATLSSPSAKFLQVAEGRDEISRSVPSTSHGFRDRVNLILVRKIDWVSLGEICKKWIRDPMNVALLLWIICVAVSGAILFLVMTGMLNHALPKKSERDTWFEINNQIINALFTLMCLYQHPKRFYHLVLLCKWRPDDITKLRKIYCKNGTYKPHEWAHMMVVVVLLHVNCFAQYALCGLNLGYKRSERPAIGVALCLCVSIAAPAFAGVYCILSPLGKEYESETDEEAQDPMVIVDTDRPSHPRAKSFQKRFSFASRQEQSIVVNRPEWIGGLLDYWDDISLAYLTFFCSFCVFGWNMERLGFGNMYVHIATFLLFCTAPFWIFNLAAVNINNEAVREALGLTGILLCVFGLLYGGFWRIQMRKKFNLPANDFCCGHPTVADCARWLFCCSCSLAQEVRTVDFYNIVEDKFCRKQMDESTLGVLSPLSHEDRSVQLQSSPSPQLWNGSSASELRNLDSPSPGRVFKGNCHSERQLPMVEEESAPRGKDNTMTPPYPSVIQRQDIHP